MKWFSQIAAALLATTALAAPMAKSSEPMTFYNLRITSKSNQFLDGKLLAVHNDEIGVYPGNPALRFYPVSVSDDEGTYQLHTHPFGVVESVIGLVGSDGLGTLKQINNPEAVQYPEGTSADWSSWALVEDTDSVDGSNHLDYLGPTGGSWVAFPTEAQDNWVVTWYDGSGFITQNFMPIEVTYEKAD